MGAFLESLSGAARPGAPRAPKRAKAARQREEAASHVEA